MTASTERRSAEKTAPLTGWAGRFVEASRSADRFSIRERALLAQVNLRGDASDPSFAAKARDALGSGLPVKPNTWTGSGERGVLWLGPDEWLVVVPPGENDALCGKLRAALAGLHHSVVDLSANRTVIEIGGTDARLVLAKGCPLDLHRSAFAPGQCAQSVIAKSQAILQCTADDSFRLYVRISFASYLSEWLLDAACEQRASRETGMPGLKL